MCTGVEIALLAGTALSAGATIMNGQQQKEMAEYSAEVAEQDANQAKADAMTQAEKVRKAMRAQQGEARAALAASGVDVGVGTAEQIETDIYARGEEDALSLILSGGRRARSLQGEAGMQRAAGGAAATGAAVSALGQIASSAATYGRWKAAPKAGG